MGTIVVQATGLAYPLLNYHLATHLSTRVIGSVLAAFGAGWLVGQVVCGRGTDLFGSRAALVGAIATAAAEQPWHAPAQSVPAPRTDVMPDQARRAEVAGWRHCAVNPGAVGGVLADRVGTAPLLFWCNALARPRRHWRPALPRPRPPRAARGRQPSPAAPRRERRAVVAAVPGDLAALTCAVGLLSSLPMLMSARGLSATACGWTQAVNALVVIALSPLITPRLSHRATAPRPRSAEPLPARARP